MPIQPFHLFANLRGRPFNRLPYQFRVRVFGVEYAAMELPDGGQLFLTPFGWSWMVQLLPDAWYTTERWRTDGHILPGGTGTVYWLPSTDPRLEMVLKFSRFAQEVPLMVTDSYPVQMPWDALAEAHFNSPFEEFGLLMDLRKGRWGPRKLRIRTKRPLAIYVPPTHFKTWQLGRSQSRFDDYHRQMINDQQQERSPIDLDIQRDYMMLFAYVKGRNAEDEMAAGLLNEQQTRRLTIRVDRELNARGFRVLDNKPKHFILRRDKHGQLLRRNGKLVYALVDFELLQHTEEYKQYLHMLRVAQSSGTI